MFLENIRLAVFLVILLPFLLSVTVAGQNNASHPAAQARDISAKSPDTDAASAETKETAGKQKYRLLQSNAFLVDTAYHQEESELEHSFTFSRTNRRNWSAVFNEEIPLGSEKHQLSFSLPAQLIGNEEHKFRGFGDARIEYSYLLHGDNASRVTISPGAGLILPVGNARKELGAGAPGISFKVPVGVMLTERLATNSVFEMTYTKSARNPEGERAKTFGFEAGQSLVWFAKPRLNFLVEAVWERSQEVTGRNLKKNEHEFIISPGVRWAHVFKNGLIVSPGLAFPLGAGPSRGEKGVFFYLAFEHSFGRER